MKNEKMKRLLLDDKYSRKINTMMKMPNWNADNEKIFYCHRIHAKIFYTVLIIISQADRMQGWCRRRG